MPNTRFYQSLLRNSPTLISTHSGDGKFISVEDTCLEILGYRPEELIGVPIFAFFHPDEMDYHQNEIGALFAQQQQFVPTLSRFKRKDGSYTWFQSMLNLSYNEDGSIENILNTQFDISTWVEMRMGLEEQETMLFESGSLAKVGAWKVDLRTNEQFWTPPMFEIFDYQGDKPPGLGKLLGWMNDREKAKRTIALAVESNKTIQEEFEVTTEIGATKYIRTIVNPVLREGRVVGLIGASQDITEDQRVRQDLENSINVLKARKRKLEDFNHIVSHNLRAPVGNIRTLIKLIKEDESPEGRAMSIEFLEKTAISLEEQLNELMGIVEIVHGDKVKAESIKVEESCQCVLDGLNGYVAQTKASIEMNLGWNEFNYPKAYFDSILLNLISNSLKYSDPDRPLVVQIETGFENERRVLKVSDNGLGIDLKKYGKKLFKLRSNVHRERKGNGVGLFYTKEQVEALDGKIMVESDVGKGSTFKVIF